MAGVCVDREGYEKDCKHREVLEKALKDAMNVIGSGTLRKTLNDAAEVRIDVEIYEKECGEREGMENEIKKAEAAPGSEQLLDVIDQAKEFNEDVIVGCNCARVDRKYLETLANECGKRQDAEGKLRVA